MVAKARPKRPAKRASRLPDLSNATPGALVDWLGGVRAEIADLKKLEGYYKEALKARIDPNEIEVEGDVFLATISDVAQARLDNDAVKDEMGQGWWDDHCKVIEFQQIRTKKL